MKTVTRFGYYSAGISFVAIIAYGTVQIAQVAGLVSYPADATLIYTTSLCIAPSFMLAILALHYSTPGERKLWSHAGLLFAVLYAMSASLMYVEQLATVIPASVKGEVNAALTVTPHSLFWTLDAMAYIFMGIATLFAAGALTNLGRGKRVRYFFIAHGIMVPVISVVYFYPQFSIPLLLLGTPWLVTAAGSMLALALWFKKEGSNL
ncbi:MAG: hypothetical protein ACTHKV_04680 [Flavipsychrobacter sp.]